MKIVRLEAENFKRLSAVEIRPDGAAVIIGGKNNAGKTSVLDAIQSLFGGVKRTPSQPIRKGSKRSTLVAETDTGIVVTRIATKKTNQLRVTAKDGTEFASPQAMLDKLLGDLTFDPLEFSRMSGRDRADVVRRVAGLDFAEHDDTRRVLFDERTAVNRDHTREAARLQSLEKFPDAPGETVQVDKLMRELKERQGVNRENEDIRRRVTATHDDVERQRGRIETLKGELERVAAAYEREVDACGRSIDSAKVGLKSLERGRDAEIALAQNIQDQDVGDIEAQIKAADETNRQVRANDAYKLAHKGAAETSLKTMRLTDEIARMDDKKDLTIESAKYPIDGLTVTDDGVELGGVPWEQASSSEQLRCAVAMGLALNPELRVVLIPSGSLLDTDSLKIVAEMVAKADGQVWIERVSEGSECTVIIEDGHVKGDEEAAEKGQAELAI